MSIIEINRNPTQRELLIFCLLLGLFTGLVGLLTYFRWDSPAVAWGIWIGGGIITLLNFTVPPLRRVFYLTWMCVTFPIGWTISHTILAILYYGILTPTGLIMRLFRFDLMSRNLRSGRDTYWEKYYPAANPKRYFRQF